MSGDAATALREAVHARLAGDAALAALLGGGGVHDTAPRGAAFPWIAVGAWRMRPLSEGGLCEHRFDLAVRSRAAGRKEAEAIAARIEALLDDAALVPAGHRLDALHVVERVTMPGRDGRSFEATASFRAVTEPI